MNWLLKTEPSEYSFADLQREKSVAWTGVANAVAKKNLRAAEKGDLCFIYETGKVKAIVGIARVARTGYPDPADADLVAIDLAVVAPLQRPVTLAEIKSDEFFSSWDLVRIGRLSVVPTPPAVWERIEKIAKSV